MPLRRLPSKTGRTVLSPLWAQEDMVPVPRAQAPSPLRSTVQWWSNVSLLVTVKTSSRLWLKTEKPVTHHHYSVDDSAVKVVDFHLHLIWMPSRAIQLDHFLYAQREMPKDSSFCLCSILSLGAAQTRYHLSAQREDLFYQTSQTALMAPSGQTLAVMTALLTHQPSSTATAIISHLRKLSLTSTSGVRPHYPVMSYLNQVTKKTGCLQWLLWLRLKDSCEYRGTDCPWSRMD